MPPGPQHAWGRYACSIAVFLLCHVAAHYAFGGGGVSSKWVILLSAGAFGLLLGVPIGQAEYYTDGYEIMTLICPAFVCAVGLVLGVVAVTLLGAW